ncbi:MAG: GTP-binding protein [Actinobacteria bacterium]|nr:MAG: GTP-binding protein [Actinomycetota bacterium]
MQSVKIVITGPYNAGKTTLIKTVSEITVLSTERKVSNPGQPGEETTVAMDFGRITIDEDVVLYLFGTPGQERFSFMWETLSEGMLGFVILVDAGSAESIGEAGKILEFFQKMSDVPYVVGANRLKDDQVSELGEIRNVLKVSDDVPVLPCNIVEKESVKKLLLGLLFDILKRVEATA